ncbi:hypothetical protein [Candidatus Thiodubiliella endoseptemdiera]|uniref:Uncharacterized protein n=1 Tax=Candidatus Thiodubiliella endoseptemdiera TaxID=2738886 RepID=A0A853F2P7_9GAMM|nr:hypothetical protein [Candidatus Thiodubiliella endoseptemdiera]
MNNHQNAIFHQITNFLKTPLALLGVDLKNFQFNKICHFANHPYLCKGLQALFGCQKTFTNDGLIKITENFIYSLLAWCVFFQFHSTNAYEYGYCLVLLLPAHHRR